MQLTLQHFLRLRTTVAIAIISFLIASLFNTEESSFQQDAAAQYAVRQPADLTFFLQGAMKHVELVGAIDKSNLADGPSLFSGKPTTHSSPKNSYSRVSMLSESPDPFEPVPDSKVVEALSGGVSFLKSSQVEAPVNAVTLLSAGAVDDNVNNTSIDKSNTYMSDASVRDALTSVQCKGAQRNRTCAFRNLYFHPESGGFVVCSLLETQLPEFESVLLLHKWSWPSLKQRTFATVDDFRKFLVSHQPTQHKGLSLVYDSIWHSNIGHALWDGLYPAFVALLEWGRHTEKFRSVIGIDPNCNQSGTADGKCMSEGIFRKFGGGEFLPYGTLQGWHCFTDSIAGSGRKGQRSINADYALPAGHSHNAARHFRNRMYASHGLPVPTSRGRSLQSRDSKVLKGIIVDNKRFLSDEVSLLREIANVSQNSSHMLRLSYVDYSSGQNHLNFTRHLELVGQASVHVSSVGTAQCYVPFLADGSVHVNLGWRRDQWPQLAGVTQKNTDRHFSSFLEEVWVEGVPYIRALHYDPFQRRPQNLESNSVSAVIGLAYKTVMDDFTMPVSPGVNLSPVGKVFKKYCDTSQADCTELISSMNGDGSVGFTNFTDNWSCNADAWAELFVFEAGGWNDIDGPCPINRKILRKLRIEEFGW